MEVEKYITYDDQQLVSLILSGDTIAFEHLFNRYRDSIRQLYMQRTGGNSDDTDDLLQETFVKVYLNIHQYDPSFTFGQWLYAIARNTFIDYIRKRRDDLSIETVQSSGSSIHTSSPTPTPEDSYISNQQRIQLDHHLGRMTPKYRHLIELRFFKEYSYEEIAAEMELPMGTVKTQIHRAREQLCRFIIDNSDMMT